MCLDYNILLDRTLHAVRALAGQAGAVAQAAGVSRPDLLAAAPDAARQVQPARRRGEQDDSVRPQGLRVPDRGRGVQRPGQQQGRKP